MYDRLKERKIYARKYFYPLTSDQICFENKYKNIDLRNARQLSKEVLVLPLYEGLEMEQIERICDLVS